MAAAAATNGDPLQTLRNHTSNHCQSSHRRKTRIVRTHASNHNGAAPAATGGDPLQTLRTHTRNHRCNFYHHHSHLTQATRMHKPPSRPSSSGPTRASCAALARTVSRWRERTNVVITSAYTGEGKAFHVEPPDWSSGGSSSMKNISSQPGSPLQTLRTLAGNCRCYFSYHHRYLNLEPGSGGSNVNNTGTCRGALFRR